MRTSSRIPFFSSVLLLMLVVTASRSEAISFSSGNVFNGMSSNSKSGFSQTSGDEYDIHALAVVEVPPDLDDKEGEKPLPNLDFDRTDSTRTVKDTGGMTEATAKAVVTFHSRIQPIFGTGLTISPAGSFAIVNNPPNSPRGRARWDVNDPLTIDFPFESIFALESGFSIQALGNAQVHFSGQAGTDRHGFETLFTLDITLNGAGSPRVEFMSNPGFGIVDSLIESKILAELLDGFDSLDNSYTLVSDVVLFTTNSLPGIPQTGTFALSFTQLGEVMTVPEPSTLFLLCSGLFILIASVGWGEDHRMR